MSEFNKFLKINCSFLIVFLLLFIFSMPRFVLSCPLFSSLSFDSQGLFVWYYAAFKGLLPYRDVFYPYGLLSYYKDIFIFPHIIYESINPIAFSLTFLLFQKLWKNSFLAIASFLFFYLFVNYFNAETFTTYGLVAIIGASFAFIFAKEEVSKDRKSTRLNSSHRL